MVRHELQTIAMELNAALHHSRDVGPGTYVGSRAQTTASSGEEVVNEPHDAQRGLTTPPPRRGRGILPVPGPQRSDHCMRRSAWDSHSSSLWFLTGSALVARRKEDEELAQEKAMDAEEQVSSQEVEG